MPPTNEITIVATQTGEGVPEGGKESRMTTRDGSLDPKMFLPCANPSCKKGGFALRAKVDKAVASGEASAKFDVACGGYVGPLRTEKGPATPCGNKLAVEVTIKAAPKPAPKKA